MKIYKCELCQKIFNQKSNLTAHTNRKFRCVEETMDYSIKDVVKPIIITPKTSKNKTKKNNLK